jgi:vacuolar-type H+-ATPase subunit E/Vma4
MEIDDKQGKQKLLNGIEQDAAEEAQKIIEVAQKTVAESKAQSRERIKSIWQEAEAKAKKQVSLIEQNSRSAIAVEKRRIMLKNRDHLINSVYVRVQQRLWQMIKQPEYKKVLLDWIIEAALGLNTRQADVNASQQEMAIIDNELLGQAEKEVKSMAGRNMVIRKTTAYCLLAQGIVLTAGDKRTAFNNQVPTRILRYQTEIRKLIAEELFPLSKEEK